MSVMLSAAKHLPGYLGGYGRSFAALSNYLRVSSGNGWRSRGGLPGGAVSGDGVEDGEELVQAGDQGQLLGFADGEQALIVGADDRVATGGDQGGHEEGGADRSAAAPAGAGAAAPRPTGPGAVVGGELSSYSDR